MSRITTLHMLRSAISDSLRSRGFIISWLNHTPRATAVYASCSASPPPHAPLVARRLARPYLDRTCTGRIAPALPGAFHLLDDLIGALLEEQRNIESERLGSLGVDDHLKFRRQLDGKLRRLCATKNAIDVG